MSDKRFKSYLTTGVFISTIVNFFLTLIIGVKDKEIYNYIILGTCALSTTFITIIMINIELYKNDKISIKKFIISSLVLSLISFAIGFLIEMLIINKLFKVDICNIDKTINTLYQTILGVIIGNNICYCLPFVNSKEK